MSRSLKFSYAREQRYRTN